MVWEADNWYELFSGNLSRILVLCVVAIVDFSSNQVVFLWTKIPEKK